MSAAPDNADEQREFDLSVWVDALSDTIYCVPTDLRKEVLIRLLSKEITRVERAKAGQLDVVCFGDISEDEFKNSNVVAEAKSLLVQVLVRSITNSHSDEGAARILFREHRHGTGGRWLPEYLNGIPGIKVDLKQCEVICAQNGKSKLRYGDD